MLLAIAALGVLIIATALTTGPVWLPGVPSPRDFSPVIDPHPIVPQPAPATPTEADLIRERVVALLDGQIPGLDEGDEEQWESAAPARAAARQWCIMEVSKHASITQVEAALVVDRATTFFGDDGLIVLQALEAAPVDNDQESNLRRRQCAALLYLAVEHL
jgi:hypothetical protein